VGFVVPFGSTEENPADSVFFGDEDFLGELADAPEKKTILGKPSIGVKDLREYLYHCCNGSLITKISLCP